MFLCHFLHSDAIELQNNSIECVDFIFRLNRGNQNYLFPVHLSDSVQPNAIFYGVALPLLTYVAIKILIVKPFLKDQEQK